MKTCFIFNPASGRNRRDPSLARRLPAFATQHGLEAELVFTRAPHHATQLARNAIDRGCERIIAVGGDGTLNEVAQAVLHSPAALGIVPCGSGNGLARHLGIPIRTDRALALAADPASGVASIDAGEADGHPFFNVMGLGFDAEISARFNRLVRRGLPAYVRTGLAAFRQHRAEAIRIDAPGISRTTDAFLVAIANSAQYGNGAFIAPGASVADGNLELVALPRPDVISGALRAARMFLGNLHHDRGVVRISAPRFTLTRNRAGPIHTDGEVHEVGPEVRVRVLPRALRVVVPLPLSELVGPLTRRPAPSEPVPGRVTVSTS